MSNHISYQDHIHIIAGIQNRVLARPEEIEDRIEQQPKAAARFINGKVKAKPEIANGPTPCPINILSAIL